jgi:carbon-monoxide dehydrogenase medium subunit
LLAEAGAAVAAAVEPVEDIHATAGYRRDLARVMTRRALEAALA